MIGCSSDFSEFLHFLELFECIYNCSFEFHVLSFVRVMLVRDHYYKNGSLFRGILPNIFILLVFFHGI